MGTRNRVRVHGITRRRLLGGAAAAGISALLAACGGTEELDPFAPAAQPEPEQSPPQETAAQQEPPAAAQAASGQQAPAAQAEPPAQVQQAAPALPTPRVYVVPQPLTQGQALLVLVDAPGAGSAAVTWETESFALLRENDRFFGFIGVDAVASPGPAALGVGVWDPDWNQLLWMSAFIEIQQVEWTSDDIQVDAANIALLDPAVREFDRELRRPFQTELTSARHWRGVFDPPVPDGEITALYGELRSFNGGPITDYHSGIDYGGPTGSPVIAPNEGVVSWAGRTDRRGNGLIIDHGAGVYSGYYHLSEAIAEQGRRVARGQTIGLIGATGLATGPHLHWEVVVRGVTVDPIPWIRAREVPDPLAEPDPATELRGANLAERET